MNTAAEYISDTESANVPSICSNNIVDFYSSGPYRMQENHTPDTPTWSMDGCSRVPQEPQDESAGVCISWSPSLNKELDPLMERCEENLFSGYRQIGLSTYASQIIRFPSLKDYLFATYRNPCAEILGRINPRVMYLSEVALEEEEQEPLSRDSYLGLVNFLNRIYNLNLTPVLGLTYEGNIRVEWRSSPNERLALEFLDSFDLKFVFFHLDSYDSNKVLRSSGDGSVLSFLENNPKALEFLRGLSD